MVLKLSIDIRKWRHMVIVMDRRICLDVGCKLYGVTQNFDKKALHAGENSDFGLDGEYGDQSIDNNPPNNSTARFHAFQIFHNQTTNNKIYGNGIELQHGLTNSLFANFRQINLQWHRDVVRFFTLSDLANSHKRYPNRKLMEISSMVKRPRMGGSNFQMRRELWLWPVIEKNLKQLFGAQTGPRNLEQRNVLILVARNRPEFIIVMPTGNGKNFLFVVFSQLPGA